MSKEYRLMNGIEMDRKTSEEMKKHCQRPGKQNEDGSPLYFTEQNHKKECDINLIIDKYDKHGVIKHVSAFEGEFGDMTGLDFKKMQDKIANANSHFNNLPWEIRERFSNDPRYLLQFMEDPNNRSEAIKLGLIANTTPPDQDGLGEHVTKNKKTETPKNTNNKTETETPKST